MADISKITLPSGSTYDIKDAVARNAIAGGVTFIVAWDGTGTPVAANVPRGVTVSGVTGTMAPSSAQAGAFYLVKSSTTPGAETLDIYDEYVVIKPDLSDNTTWFWEKIGDTKLNLTDVVTGVTLNKATDTVVGTDASFTVTQPKISLSTTATAETGKTVSVTTGLSGKGSSGSSVGVLTALGNPTTSSVLTGVKITTQPTITLATGATAGNGVISVATGASGTTKYIGGSATGGSTSWRTKDNQTVVTGYESPTSNSFVTGVSATSRKLKTTTITGVNGSTSPKVVPDRQEQTTATGATTSVSDNSKILANVSVANEVLTIGAVNLSTQTTYSAAAPTQITIPTAATETIVATGAVVDSTVNETNGATVVIAASASGNANALTGLGSPTTASVIGANSEFSNTPPQIELSLADTTAEGKVGVITGVSASTTNIKATASGTAVGADGTANAVTGYPNITSDTISVSATNTNIKGSASDGNVALDNKDSITVLTDGTNIAVTKAQ